MNKPLMVFAAALCFQAFGADSLERRVRVATEVVTHRMASAEPVVPQVVRAARCVAAMKVVKTGFIWGGEGSTGLVTCKRGGSWSSPSFFDTGGVTFGIQIGVQFMESLLFFMTGHAEDILQHASFQLGTDLSFAAGPVGSGQGVGVIPDAHVLTYSFTQGLFAGATVNGLIVTHDRPRNRKAYGSDITPPEILAMQGESAPQVVQPFVGAVKKHLAY